MKLIISILLLTFLSLACREKENKNKKAIKSYVEKNDSTWIIFKNKTEKGAYISYVNEYGEEVVYGLDNKDILILPLQKGVLAIIHCKKNKVQVPCFPNDTIIFDFARKGFQWQITNRVLRPYDTLFSKIALLRERRYKRKLDSLSRLTLKPVPGSCFSVMKKNIPNAPQIFKCIYDINKAKLESNFNLLDSFAKCNAISEVFYNIFKTAFVTHFLDQTLFCFREINDSVYFDKLFRDTNYFNNFYMNSDADGSYKNMLRAYLVDVILKGKSKWISAHEISFDYVHAYDSAELFLSSQLLDYARFVCLNEIKQNNSPQIFSQYYAKFIKQTLDSGYRTYVVNKFRLQKVESNANKLLNMRREQIDLAKLISAQYGKMLVIDFWASWCMPCIQSINDSRSTLENIDTSKFKVIFLSLDQDLQDWTNASQKLGLYENNYCMLDSKNSNFLKQIKLSEIPRTILLNTKGEIISLFAPPIDSKKFIIYLEGQKDRE